MNHDLPPNFDPHVRDALRGLFAAPRRVRQVHDELLAHLLASYDEERAAGHDPASAARAALRRLGDPATLRRQLQSSVPLVERLFFQALSKEAPMSRWIWLLAVFAFFFGTGIVLPALAKHKHQGVPWPDVAIPLAVGLLITLAGVGTLAYGLVHYLRRRTAA